MPLTNFRPLDELVEETKRLSAGDLDAYCDCPVLVILPTADTVMTERLEITNPSHAVKTQSPPPALVTLVFPIRPGLTNVDRKRLSVGRDETCDVPIPLGTVSKLHAWLIESSRDAWAIQDAGSTNGTWVDGRGVRGIETTPLRDGCEIRLGENLATFWLPASLRAALRRRAGVK